METDGIKRAFFLLLFLTALFIFLPAQPVAFGRDSASRTEGIYQRQTVKRGIVILVEFPDVKHEPDRDRVELRFSRHLNGYFRQMSYNRVSLQIDLTERWYQMSDSISPMAKGRK
jgi:hypothetical protein